MIPVWALLLVIALAVAALVGLWLSLTASRLNRLHIRTDAARLSLEGALQARSAVVAAIRPELVRSAGRTTAVALKASDMDARSDAENVLLRQLRDGDLANPAFVEASVKVDIAARFYNDAVGDTRDLRKRPVVRVFRLAGSAPLPAYYEAMSVGDGTV
ncbi:MULTISPECIES: hypothetical protein [unclassified Corynebacterium]|uniref:hypothetical protein n=1 Tax=unclassified Corynebacterium TaxID=2624378 RepID=UPI0030AA736E